MPRSQNKHFGKTGEDLAVEILRENGYHVLERNFRTRLGEIDIIARHHETVCFVEVKTRKTLARGLPQEAVGPAKMRKLVQVALCYLKQNKLLHHKARFDVVAILEEAPDRILTKIIPNAFEMGEYYSY